MLYFVKLFLEGARIQQLVCINERAMGSGRGVVKSDFRVYRVVQFITTAHVPLASNWRRMK